MNILLTTHQLAGFAGSELFTYEVAKGLTAAGHTVTVYSRYLGEFTNLFSTAGIAVVADLEHIKTARFDVAHVQHHINALEVRLAFPDLPIFYLSHGSKVFLELPPAIETNIALYGAVSHGVRKNLIRHGVHANKIEMVKNLVDSERFTSPSPIHATPRSALVISNRIDEKTLTYIRQACQRLGLSLTVVGSEHLRVTNAELPHYINQADVVFTIGRGVIETMMCGRIPFIVDAKGGDGLLTLKLLRHSARHNFNGDYRDRHFTTAQIIKELRQYDASEGPKLQMFARRYYSAPAVVSHLEKIYLRTTQTHRAKKINLDLLAYVVRSIHVTRLHTFSQTEVKSLPLKIREVLFEIKQTAKAKLKRWIKMFEVSRLSLNSQTP